MYKDKKGAERIINHGPHTEGMKAKAHGATLKRAREKVFVFDSQGYGGMVNMLEGYKDRVPLEEWMSFHELAKQIKE
jgi:hypothetical protein